MAKTEYNRICTTLEEKMEDGTYVFQELLPSENTLVRKFGCSRNITRRAIGQLASEEYVQGVYGKGVRIIYQPGWQQSEFILGGIESLKKTVARNRKNYTTRVVCFAELTMSEAVRKRTTFPVGTQIYCMQRVHCIEGEALVIDHSYFLKDVVQGLVLGITERSTYEYIENDLGESIVTTKREMTVKCVNQIGERYLDLKDYNCMTVMSSIAHNKKGVMFEFTQSRHRPNRFIFYDLAHRTKQVNQGTGEQKASGRCSSSALRMRNVKEHRKK